MIQSATRSRKPSAAHRAAASDRHHYRIAAIDVGSNSLHMAVAQADPDGSITTLWRMKEMVGLGRISFPSRRLTREAIDRAVTTLARFQQAARVRGVEKILAVATSAVREAENGGDFLRRVRQELGMTLKVVSARDEAKLIYLGVRHAVDLDDKPHFIVDIGGGSVEFIVGDAHKAMLLESRKLGAARMTAKFIFSDPVRPEELKALRAHYDRELAPICRDVLALGPVAALGTSGTLENLATMCAAISSKAERNGAGKADRNGSAVSAEPGVLERSALSWLVTRLISSTSEERALMHGLDDQRKDQVLAGAVLMEEVFRRLDLKEIRVCRSALREGMLMEYLGRHLPELQIRRQVPDPRRRSVLDLARRCHWHQAHSEHAANLCMQLFDCLKPLHGLVTEERELIEFGALLHDIGWHIARERHHKHSEYLILNGNLQNFTPEEVAVIASIARYHRKANPGKRHETYAGLSKRSRRTVRIGAALLRIADSLDRTHVAVISSLKCRISKSRIDIRLKGRGDAELEIWAARNKTRLFEKVFGREVHFEYVA
jgi:exopolyphosphatase/guanosine-5'-triphosphate,3'-diphosphate pyrophosphatase